MDKIFFNNRIVDGSQALISHTDSGFLYGAGLFETMRSANGVIFAIDDHLERLFSSASKLDIKLTGDKKFFTDAIYQTLEANGLKDARIRLTATNGTLATDGQISPTTVIAASAFQPYPQQYYDKGVMVILNSYRHNPSSILAGHKTTNYFANLSALAVARQKQAAEALWFTADGRLTEGCVSNIFIVKNSVLYTPSLELGILAGVARKHICAIAQKNGIKLEKRKDLGIKELLDADEVFITNVIMQVMGVVRIEAHNIADGCCGALTKKIASLYAEHFDREVGAI